MENTKNDLCDICNRQMVASTTELRAAHAIFGAHLACMEAEKSQLVGMSEDEYVAMCTKRKASAEPG